ncbi:MAG: branched-chain amino acid ABC transporter permease [Armatimonadota bacterium]|nr:branched-chain amino acid ABC transporter permease [bacterium]
MGQYLGLFFANGVVIGSIYALIALSFNVIYSTTGIINFAQGEFVMIGALTTAWLHVAMHLAMPLAILAGVFTAAVVGLACYLVGLRPAKGASPVTYIIITIAISIILKSLASFVWGTDPYTLPKLVQGGVRIGAGEVDKHSLLVIPVAGMCMLLLVLFFRYTRVGLNMRACAENKEGARLCGISVNNASAASFALGAALAGVGGVMITPILSMQFDAGMMMGIKGFSGAILGGFGNPIGCVIGGLMVGVIEQFICYFSSGYKDILALVIVVVLLLLRPRGILSR